MVGLQPYILRTLVSVHFGKVGKRVGEKGAFHIDDEISPSCQNDDEKALNTSELKYYGLFCRSIPKPSYHHHLISRIFLFTLCFVVKAAN